MPKRILFVLTSHDRKGQAESKDAAPRELFIFLRCLTSTMYSQKKDMKLIS